MLLGLLAFFALALMLHSHGDPTSIPCSVHYTASLHRLQHRLELQSRLVEDHVIAHGGGVAHGPLGEGDWRDLSVCPAVSQTTSYSVARAVAVQLEHFATVMSHETVTFAPVFKGESDSGATVFLQIALGGADGPEHRPASNVRIEGNTFGDCGVADAGRPVNAMRFIDQPPYPACDAVLDLSGQPNFVGANRTEQRGKSPQPGGRPGLGLSASGAIA